MTHIRTRYTVLIFGGLLAFLAPIAAHAQAYYTPEEILYEQEYFFPPRPRSAQGRVTEQALFSTERRERAQRNAGVDPYTGAYLIPPVEVPVVQREDPILSLADAINRLALIGIERPLTIEERRREERLLQRLGEEQVHLFLGRRTNSGAPLAGTGPASALIAMALLGAVGWTLHRAKRVTSF